MIITFFVGVVGMILLMFLGTLYWIGKGGIRSLIGQYSRKSQKVIKRLLGAILYLMGVDFFLTACAEAASIEWLGILGVIGIVISASAVILVTNVRFS